MKDQIRKQFEIKSPLPNVWRALTDYREFGAWFNVKLEEPFVIGKESKGKITYPGYEHIAWRATVEDM